MASTKGTALTEIKGIGDAKAEQLREKGFEGAEDILAASPSDLAVIDGIGEARGKEIHQNARDLLTTGSEGNEGDTTSDEEENESEPNVDESEEIEEEYEFDVDFSTTQYDHLFAGLVEIQVEERRRKHYDNVDELQELMTQLKNEEERLHVNRYQFQSLYRASTTRKQKYQQTRGLSELAAELNEARTRIANLRQHYMF